MYKTLTKAVTHFLGTDAAAAENLLDGTGGDAYKRLQLLVFHWGSVNSPVIIKDLKAIQIYASKAFRLRHGRCGQEDFSAQAARFLCGCSAGHRCGQDCSGSVRSAGLRPQRDRPQ